MTIAVSICDPFDGLYSRRRAAVALQPGGGFASINGVDEIRRLLERRKFREAFELLLDGYEKKVFRMAVTMLRDTGRAEEITQDIFLKLWQALPSYDGRAAVSTWLYTIARNTCFSAIRAESYRRTEELVEANAPRSEAGAADHLDLGRQVAALPDIQRQAITLFYFEERSIAEVAEMLDLPEGTVKSHLHRARRTLGEMME
jgi:RNA polymerase sigma-70 factor (ECF subfamily)